MAATTFPRREPKRIDARAVRRDMSGNIVSEPGEKAFTGVKRGMGGEPLSGTNILTQAPITFPQPGRAATGVGAPQGPTPSGQPVAPPAPGALPAPAAPTAFPGSGMRTGNSNVVFQSAADRAAQMAQASKTAVFAQGRAATLARRNAATPAPYTSFPTPTGAPATVANKTGGGGKELSSPYGAGSSILPKAPLPGAEPAVAPPQTRIADETGDRTAEFAFPKPKRGLASN